MTRLHNLHRFALCCLGLAAILSAQPAWADEPFDYFSNSWSVVGLKDYNEGARITPDNELLLADGAKLRFRVGTNLQRLSREQTKTLLDGWLPVVLLTANDNKVQYEFVFWSTPLTTVKDYQQAFDWPTEGENFLNWIVIKATNTGSAPAEANLLAEKIFADKPAIKTVKSLQKMLEPGGVVEVVLRVPFWTIENEDQFSQEDAGLWLTRTVHYWKGLMAKAAHIEVPCTKANQALLAAHVCQAIASDHGELHGGEGFYDEFYIRDGGYQIMELEEAGMFDEAGKAIEHYLTRQRPDGRFESQPNQFDANGQAVWVLWQYFKITNDKPWLAKVYPQMRRAADWTIKARKQTPADSPFAGVLPNALADGEYLWDGKYHIVGYDLWNLRGMLCTADAAKILGKTDEADELLREADLYRADIDAAHKRTGLAHFPPSWEKAGTHWGNTETLWPTELFTPDDARVAALLEEVRERHGGGFIEGTIQWLGLPDAIHPYMSAYSTMASLARGEHEKVVEEFYWYLLHSSATHAFPEGIFYKRRFAWSHTIPHVTGASNYAILLRHMLIHERGDELHLLSAVPDGWLDPGQVIRVENAPTHFGPMSLIVRGTEKGVTVELDPPKRNGPERIVLHLPASRPLTGSLENVEIATRSEQTKRWDFATVVDLYEKDAPPVFVAIEGLVTFPIGQDIPTNKCQNLDLSNLANTDPFTAPFGVKNPGKLLFTDMPVGMQTVGGVPFKIIDPKANEGRGLVVLHSDAVPASKQWPRQVEIPVNAKAKRVFFLGNVTGWGTGDAAFSNTGAVAEYVIHYTDGQTQTVPLIDGRTCDDWTRKTQNAIDVYRGLTGDPWHLNLLGVKLRPTAVEKIVFRDLGTKAAPVLAAVTIEQ